MGLLLLVPALLPAQSTGAGDPAAPARAAPGDTVLVEPAGRYEAGPLHRLVLGGGHRELWDVRIPVEVLDLGSFAGGLVPMDRGGGLQTLSLRFRGGDGQLWTFRSVDKDAARVLDPALRETLPARVLQDQISALFPLSAMVVAPLLEAAGVLHPDPRLVLMPDDPRLGEFREEFAGVLGWIEVRPDEGPDGQPGFAGSERVISSERLLERLEEDPDDRVDAVAFLRARLLDMYVGDWDRHPDQWRWAGFEREGRLVFEPVPRDRDWALSRIDGLVGLVGWIPWPHRVGFDHEFPSAFRMSWSGRALDRPFLSGLSREEFLAVAEDLRTRLDDGVIEDAVRRLPEAYYARVGESLTAALKHRRDRLPALAGEYYALLAGWAEVRGTDREEEADVEWLDPERVRVRLLDEDGRAFFERVFHAAETEEVRIDLRGDDDRAVVRGSAGPRPVIRVVGGGSDDVLEDRTTGEGRVRFHDDRGDNRIVTGPRTTMDATEWEDPVDPEENTHRAGHRDWGSRTLPVGALTYDPDRGVVVGGGVQWTEYGFRHYPFETRVRWTGVLGATEGGVRTNLLVDLPLRGRRLRLRTGAGYSDLDVHRFYGFGNETEREGPDDRFLAERREARLESEVVLDAGRDWSVAVGPSLALFREIDAPGTLVSQVDPYGWGDFDQVGLTAALEWDGRDDVDMPRSGGRLRVEGRWFPGLLDVRESFGGARAVLSTYLSSGGYLHPTLALRFGGEHLVGDVPYHEAAYLGGRENLRGYRNERFAGTSALFANAELRAFLSEFVFLLPGDLGAFLLADAGRVFVDGESPAGWHPSGGLGLWASFFDIVTLSGAWARGDDGSGLYFAGGFLF